MKYPCLQNLFFTAFMLFICSLSANAQISLPLPSPHSSVMSTIGLTEVKISYSSPAVKGRKIWGDLLPNDSLWRAGANEPTRISFSTDVKVAGTEVKKGEYSLYIIPAAQEWTFIISKDSKGNGVFSYDKNDDLARFKVSPQSAEFKERLAYYVDSNTDKEGTVSLHWEKVKASFKVESDVMKALVAGVNDFTGNWFDVAGAAEYYANNNGDLKVAQKLAETAIAMAGENLYTAWVKAQVSAKQGNKQDALNWGQKAKKMGEESKGGFLNFYNNTVKKPLEASLKQWGAK